MDVQLKQRITFGRWLGMPVPGRKYRATAHDVVLKTTGEQRIRLRLEGCPGHFALELFKDA
jgi:hypothetical protein